MAALSYHLLLSASVADPLGHERGKIFLVKETGYGMGLLKVTSKAPDRLFSSLSPQPSILITSP